MLRQTVRRRSGRPLKAWPLPADFDLADPDGSPRQWRSWLSSAGTSPPVSRSGSVLRTGSVLRSPSASASAGISAGTWFHGKRWGGKPAVAVGPPSQYRLRCSRLRRPSRQQRPLRTRQLARRPHPPDPGSAIPLFPPTPNPRPTPNSRPAPGSLPSRTQPVSRTQPIQHGRPTSDCQPRPRHPARRSRLRPPRQPGRSALLPDLGSSPAWSVLGWRPPPPPVPASSSTARPATSFHVNPGSR